MAKVKAPEKRGVISLQQLLHSACADVNKVFKGRQMASIVEDTGLRGNVTSWISTGSLMLDLAMRGGIPIGRVIELYGYPSSGKSTLTAHVFANCQKMGGVAALVDSESTWESERAASLGVRLGNFARLEAKTVEEGFNAIEEFVVAFRSKPGAERVPMVVAWDTIAKAKTGTDQAAKSMDDRYSGGMIEKPKLIQQGMRRFLDMVSDNRIAMIMVNQLIAGPKGNTTPGGNALKFDSSMRINMIRKMAIKDSEGDTGIMTLVKVEKNKVSGAMPKTGEVEIPIMHTTGIDDAGSILFYLKSVGAVKVGGGWYRFTHDGEEHTFRQRDFGAWLAEKSERRSAVEKLVRDNFLRKAGAVAEDVVADDDGE